jgi:glyoxylate reductase
MAKNILITGKIPEIAIRMLESKGYVVDKNKTDRIPTQKDIIKMIKRKAYDAVITFLTDKIDAKVFDASPNLKMYVNYASGFDNIDIVEKQRNAE